MQKIADEIDREIRAPEAKDHANRHDQGIKEKEDLAAKAVRERTVENRDDLHE
jgi:hypothetical protein